MADPSDFLDEELGVTETGQPVPVNPPVAGPDPSAFLDVEQPAIQQQPLQQAPAPEPDPSAFLDEAVTEVRQEQPLPPEPIAAPGPSDFLEEAPEIRPTRTEAFVAGVERGTQELIVGLTEDLPGLGAEAAARFGLLGQEGELREQALAFAQEKGQRAQRLREEIRARSPEPVFANYTEISNVDDAVYWATERFGEQVPNLLAFGMSSAAGAGTAIAMRAAGALKVSPRVGAAIGGFLGATSLESAFIASEQFEATGSFNPAVTVPAGIGAGALEFLVPFKFMREIGKGDLYSFIKTPIREAVTELMQETIAVTAREITDPNYKFFSPETKIRLVESFLAGGVVGAPFGALSTARAGLRRKKGVDDSVPITRPGPLSWLRDRKGRNRPESSGDALAEGRTTPVDDAIETNYLDDELNRQFESVKSKEGRLERLQDLEDDHLPRYVIIGEDGRGGNQVLPATSLEEELARRTPLAVKPRIQQVNMDSLQPGLITADVFDLPLAGDTRIWFMPGVTEQEKTLLNDQYLELQAQAAGTNRLARGPEAVQARQSLLDLYNELLVSGLRVIPSRGQGFFYTGTAEVQGAELSEVPETRRSVQTFFIDPSTNVLHEPAGELAARTLFGEGKTPALEPVAIDWDQMPAGSVQRDPDGTLKILKELPEKAITFGYALRAEFPASFLAVKQQFGEPGAILHDAAATSSTRIRRKAQRRVAWLHEFKPFLEGLQKRLGIKNFVRFLVLETPDVDRLPGDARATYDIGANLISINAFAPTGNLIENTKVGFLLTVLHEIGHAVTINAWAKLDPRVKAKIYEGYKRALLRNRIRGDFDHVRSVPTIGTQDQWAEPSKFYYLTFTEYLAEQFRRWAISKREALGSDETFMAQMGRKIDELYKEYGRKVGVEQARELFTPDYTVSTWMDLLLDARDKPESPMRLSRRLELTNVVPIPEDLQVAYRQVVTAMEQFGFLLPRGVRFEINTFAEGEETSLTPQRGEFDHKSRVLKIFIGALAKYKGRDSDIAAKTLVHEMWHAVERSLTDAEHAALVRLAKDEKVMPAGEEGRLRREYREHLRNTGFNPDEYLNVIERWLNDEHVAFLIEARFRGAQYGPDASTILDRIIAFYRRVVQVITGNGIHDPEDVLKAFFRGDFTRRTSFELTAAREARLDQRAARVAPVVPRTPWMGIDVAKMPEDIPGRAGYMFFTQEGQEIGYMDLVEEEGIGWDIEMIRIYPAHGGQGHQLRMLSFVQQDLNTRLQASGTLTRAGYRMVRRMAPDQVKFHVFDPAAELWYSPRQVEIMIENAEINGNRERVRKMKALKAKVPKDAFKDPELDKKFARTPGNKGLSREYERSQAISDQKLVQATTGVQAPPEPFVEQMNSELTGDAPPAAANEGLHNMLNWVASTEKDLVLSQNIKLIINRADKISKFSKIFFNILQIAQRNPHIGPLIRYVANMEGFNAKRMFWVQTADETAKDWDALPERQRNAVSDLAFWATEMRYLTPQEVQQGVVRHPTPQEFLAEARRLRLSRSGVRVFDKMTRNFEDFLADLERVTIQSIQRRVTDPAAQAAAIAEVQADMQSLRSRPYFPFIRFGEFAITIKNQFAGNRVEHFSLYPTARERNAARAKIQAQFPGMELITDKVPENVHEFMGLPATLLRRIKTDLPGITQAQKDWMEQFETLMAPERSFRKRFLRRKGTPGYSLDGMRVFAHYFRSGANYLARIEFKDQLEQNIKEMDARTATFKNRDKSRMITEYMRSHLDYVMTGGSDWATFKSLVAIFQLGLSVAAAGINLTQNVVTTWPWLTARFGNVGGTRELLRIMRAARNTMGKPPPGQTADFIAARQEMIEQGKIDVGQASELGGFAEGPNLLKMMAGTKAQKWWRNFQRYSMILFQTAESFNREIAFAAAYTLAIEQANTNKWLQEFSLRHNMEVNQLMAKRGMTHAQATATLAAREAIQETQFEYSPYARPTFLRSGPASSVLVFFQFLQNMLFQMGNSPGKVKMWFVMLALYGVSGIPGSDDVNELIRVLAKMFKIDFNPKLEARKAVRELTRNTIFDQTGPDLVMHGLSRYSYGLGLFADGYGVPQFDASASGSMARIVPGMQEGLRTIANGGRWKDFTGEVARDVAGAGFGQVFQWMQLLESDPFSGDGTWKKWERTFPRGIKAISRAGRYGVMRGDINPRTGERFVRFNLKDPDDVSTLVAQALGFTPRKVTQKWEALRTMDDVAGFYNSRRHHLLTQFSAATREEDAQTRRGAVDDVMKRVRQFNKEMDDIGFPEMGLTQQTLTQSAQARARVKARREAGLPLTDQQIRLQQRIFDTFPGVQVEQEKVK